MPDAPQPDANPRADEQGPQLKVKQHSPHDADSTPRLPHEHDESSDSQKSGQETTPQVGKQAFQDVRSGKVDTDRGPVFDHLRNDPDSPLRPTDSGDKAT